MKKCKYSIPISGVMVLLAFLLLAAAVPAAPTPFYQETWNSVTSTPRTVGNGVTLTPAGEGTDNTWNSYWTKVSSLVIEDVAAPLSSRAVNLKTTTTNSTADVTLRSSFSPTITDDWTSVTVSFKFLPNGAVGRDAYVYLGSDGGTAVETSPPSTNNYYFRIYSTNGSGPPTIAMRIRVRNAAGSSDKDIGVFGDLTTNVLWEVSCTFRKVGTNTFATYSMKKGGVAYPAGTGTYTFPRALAAGTPLDRVVLLIHGKPAFAFDDIQVTAEPKPPAGDIIVAPTSLLIGAPSGGTGTQYTTISNVGNGVLNLDALSLGPQTHPGAFSIDSGGGAGTIAGSGGTRVVTIKFDESLTVFAAGHATPSTSTLRIVSDSNGTYPTTTTLALAGWRNDNFVWNTSEIGGWDVASKWTPAAVPGSEDTAAIGSGLTTRSVALTIDPALTGHTSGVRRLSLTGGELRLSNVDFNIASTADRKTSFTQTGGILNTYPSTLIGDGDVRVGQVGTGKYNLTDGTINTRQMGVGQDAYSSGTLNVTNGTVTVADSFTVASSGSSRGTLNVTNGTISAANSFNVASGISSIGAVKHNSGTMTVSNGSLTVGGGANSVASYTHNGTLTLSAAKVRLYVGEGANSAASFIQKGGFISLVVNTTSDINIAGGLGATGTYTMEGGTLNGGSYLHVGKIGTGVFNLLNGTVSAPDGPILGDGAAAVGTLNITTGTLTTAADKKISVGNNGKGYYTQNNGKVSTGDFRLGENVLTAEGTANLNGGSLTLTGEARIGTAGTGRLTVDGTGKLTAATVSMGRNALSSGTLTVKNGTITTSGDINVGYNGRGTYVQQGGSVTGKKIFLGKNAGSQGAFSMSNGTLTADSITTGAGTVNSWSWTGGTISVGTVQLSAVPMVNNGGTLSPGGAGVGTTMFVGTDYTQTASGVLPITLIGVTGDQLVMNGSSASVAGAINVTHSGSTPPNGTTWDIIITTPSGSVNIGSAVVTLPAPTVWSKRSNSQIVTVAYSSHAGPDLASTAGTPHTFDPILLGLGETFKDASFTIKNVGMADLTVSSLVPSPGRFTVVSPLTGFTLKTGESQLVTLRISETVPGLYPGTLTVNSNDTESAAIVIDLAGSVVGLPNIVHDAGSKITFRSIVLDLGQSQKDTTFTIQNTGEVSLTVGPLLATPSEFTVVSPASGFVVPASGSQEVRLRFTATTLGIYTGTLTINSDDPDTLQIIIDLEGRVQATSTRTRDWYLYD